MLPNQELTQRILIRRSFLNVAIELNEKYRISVVVLQFKEDKKIYLTALANN